MFLLSLSFFFSHSSSFRVRFFSFSKVYNQLKSKRKKKNTIKKERVIEIIKPHKTFINKNIKRNIKSNSIMVRKLKLRNIIKYKIHTIISKKVAIFHIGTNSIYLFLLEKKRKHF